MKRLGFFLHIWINDVSNLLAWFKQKISSPNQQDFWVVAHFFICHFMIINKNCLKVEKKEGCFSMDSRCDGSGLKPVKVSRISKIHLSHFKPLSLYSFQLWTKCPQTGIINGLNTQSVSTNCPSYCTQFSKRVEFPRF